MHLRGLNVTNWAVICMARYSLNLVILFLAANGICSPSVFYNYLPCGKINLLLTYSKRLDFQFSIFNMKANQRRICVYSMHFPAYQNSSCIALETLGNHLKNSPFKLFSQNFRFQKIQNLTTEQSKNLVFASC